MSRLFYHKGVEEMETHAVVWGWWVRVRGCSIWENRQSWG